MSVKQMADGRWYAFCRYKDFTGKVRQKKKTGFPRKKDAQEWLAKFQQKVAGSETCAGMTIAELAEEYYKDAEAWGLKKTTLYTLKREHLPRIVKAIGTRKVSTFTPDDAQEFIRYIAQHYVYTGASNMKRITSGMFRYAMRRYNLPRNPFSGLKLHKPETVQREAPTFWTIEQFTMFDSILEAKAAEHPQVYPYRVIFCIAFWAGLRRGEIFGLRVGDIDFDKQIIHVRQNMNMFSELTTLKTESSRRDIVAPACLVELLREYISRAIFKPSTRNLLFEGIQPNTATVTFRRYRKKYTPNLPPIHLHSLRHSHASMLIDLDIPPRIIANRLGHTDTAMLDRVYGHIYEQRQVQVAEKLEQRGKEAKNKKTCSN